MLALDECPVRARALPGYGKDHRDTHSYCLPLFSPQYERPTSVGLSDTTTSESSGGFKHSPHYRRIIQQHSSGLTLSRVGDSSVSETVVPLRVLVERGNTHEVYSPLMFSPLSTAPEGVGVWGIRASRPSIMHW